MLTTTTHDVTTTTAIYDQECVARVRALCEVNNVTMEIDLITGEELERYSSDRHATDRRAWVHQRAARAVPEAVSTRHSAQAAASALLSF